jgi:hypothetical protein
MEEPRALHPAPNRIRMIKSRRTRYGAYATLTGKTGIHAGLLLTKAKRKNNQENQDIVILKMIFER